MNERQTEQSFYILAQETIFQEDIYILYKIIFSFTSCVGMCVYVCGGS